METPKPEPKPTPVPVAQPTGLKLKSNVQAGPDFDITP
jgi:hypothetical protein